MADAAAAPCAVMDCMVYLQAVANEAGPAAMLIREVEMRRITLLVSEEILDEVREVLSRPSFQRKFPRLTPERAQDLVIFLTEWGLPIDPVPSMFTVPRDPKDEKYLS